MRCKVILRSLLIGLSVFSISADSTLAFSGAGSGTEADPYIITNVAQLQEMNDDLSAWYELGNNIDASSTRTWNGGDGFIPIGWDSSHRFSGHFHGRGHTISGLYIHRPDTDYVGLFGSCWGSVKDCGLINVEIVGREYVGGLVGVGYGSIAGCCTTGSLSGQDMVGGLIGGSHACDIGDCYSTASVSGDSYVGGLIGFAHGGLYWAYVTHCYSAGQVNDGVAGSNVGGLVGLSSTNTYWHSCYWDMETSGQATSAAGSGRTTQEMQWQATYTFAAYPWDFNNTWNIDEATGYPFLRVFTEDPQAPPPCKIVGSGTEQDPYIVTNVKELQAMRNHLSAWYELGNDIDVSVTSGWHGGDGFIPIGLDSLHRFSGHFDGRGHTISGLYIHRPDTDYVGLFGSCWGSVKDCGLINVEIVGREYVGGLVGVGYGSIAGCCTTGSLSGQDMVGGLIGGSHACNIGDCYSTASVSGDSYVGGLTGFAHGGPYSAYVTHCYSAGRVNNGEAGSNVGGLVGLSSTNTYWISCYWDMKTSGQTTSPGGVGKTTAEMKQQATFVGWDFVSVWDIQEGASYPFLRAVGGSMPGLEWVEVDDPEGADILASPIWGSDILKHVPKGWVLKAVNTSPLTLYYEVTDVTDNLSGWVHKSTAHLGGDGSRAAEITSADERASVVLEAASQLCSDFLPSHLPLELVLAICCEETGPLYDWDNEIISGDCGRGIMQITTSSYVGRGSDIRCYSNGCTKCPVADGSCRCYYTNTIQGIVANVKDGLYALRDKYRTKCPQDPITVDGMEFSCYDIERILTVWGYNGFARDKLTGEYTGNYLGRVAGRLEAFDTCFPGQTYEDPDNLVEKLKIANANKETVRVYSPCEMYVVDASASITGLVSGQILEEIVASMYDPIQEAAVVLFPTSPLVYNVRGTASGVYDLTADSTRNGDFTIFRASGIEMTPGVIHQYEFDWQSLSEGGDGTTMRVDRDGDGMPEQTIVGDTDLTAEEFALQTATSVDFDPDTLNLIAPLKFVTIYIELPNGFEVGQINVSTIKLNDAIPALPKPTKVADHDEDGKPDLMVKFDGQTVCQLLSAGQQTIRVSGRLTDERLFAGTDTIRVLDGMEAESAESLEAESLAIDTSSAPTTPVANAGLDVQILSAEQGSTVVRGIGRDADGDPLDYRWLEDDMIWLGWLAVGNDGTSPLDLESLDYLAIGDHILTLEVTDGESTGSDSMTLTIENTPPTAKAMPMPGPVIAGMNPIALQGEVSDFDGDMLEYEWVKDGEVLGEGSVEPPRGGASVPLPELIIPPGDRRFPVGRHEAELRVYDGTNDPASASVTVEVIDI